MAALSILHRKAIRDLWHMRSQALAIAAVMAAGIAMLVMSTATLQSLLDTRDRLYQEYRFSHAWAQVKRAPWAIAQRIAELPGVTEVETRLTSAAKLELPGYGQPIEAMVQSLPAQGMPNQNRLYLRTGRMPEPWSDREVLVSESFAQAHQLKPGDRLRATLYGRAQWFTVVGTAVSPEFIYQIKPGAMFPDYERYAILWLRQQAMAAALDMDGAFNEITLRLAPEANEREVLDRIDSVLLRSGGRGAHGRMQQLSYRFLHEEFRQLSTMARVFPVIFLGVAAFLLHVVFARLVATQRDQVAILKAFGYSTWEVAMHFGTMATIIALAGAAFGVALGVWLGVELAGLYQLYFRFPFLDFQLTPGVVVTGIGVSLTAAWLGAGRSVLRVASQPVAQAMRPETPENYRRTLLERLGLDHWLAQPTRIIWRQIHRHPTKTLLTVLGLAMAGAIVIMARFQVAAIHHMVEVQFRLAQKHDLSAHFTEPVSRRALSELAALEGVQHVEGVRQVPVRIKVHQQSVHTSILGLDAATRLRQPLNDRLQPIRLPSDGLVINDYLARQLEVTMGDHVWIEVLEGRMPSVLLPVTQITNEVLGMQTYMELAALNRALGDGDVISGVLISARDGTERDVVQQLEHRPRVAGVESRRSAVTALYRSIAEMTGLFTWMALLMGALINFGVVYNSARIALAERARELASLRVLGFTQGEASFILLGEMALLVLVSLPLGFAAGYGLSWFLAHSMESDLYRVPVHLPATAYAESALITVACAVVSALAVVQRIRKLDLIAVLKTRE